MSIETPRLRIIAGPNGSGKSTILESIKPDIRGVYINADDIQRELQKTGSVSLEFSGIQPDIETAKQFFADELNKRNNKNLVCANDIVISGNLIQFSERIKSDYHAAVAADFLRTELLAMRKSFTFETVMSHPSKVDFMREAQSVGYRTYLYYVATGDPEINVARIKARVLNGGHDVPEEKARSRYARSLELLPSAIKNSDRAYIFDNSGLPGETHWIAEITDGTDLEIRTEDVPDWFKKAVLDNI